MFCKNCGAQVSDSQKFCPNCGAPVQQPVGSQNAGGGQSTGNGQNPGASQPQGGYQQGSYNGGYQQQPYNGYPQGGKPPKKSSAKPVIFIVIGVIILIAAVVGVIFGLRSCSKDSGGGLSGEKKSSYTDPIDSMMEGIEKQDGDIILSAFSDGTIEVLEAQSGMSKSEIADMFEEMFAGSMGMGVEEGAFQVDYEITDETDLSKDDIADIQEEFDSEGADEKIEEGKALEITMIIGMEDITDETYEDSIELQVIKIDGKWYVDPTSM